MNILLCTTEELMLTTLEFRFRKNGWKMLVAETAKKAIDLNEKSQQDLVVVDLEMPNFEGLDVVQFLRKSNPALPIITYGTVENEKLLLESQRLGADDFVIAPIKPDELTIRIRRQAMRALTASKPIAEGMDV